MTPFKGMRVYTRPVMGLPGSSKILDKLSSLAFGEMVEKGFMAKIADDHFIVVHTAPDLIYRFELYLSLLQSNNLSINSVESRVLKNAFHSLS